MTATYSPTFNASVQHTLVDEGVLSDNPNDSGGVTKFGITIPFLTDYLGRPATAADIKGLKRDTAIDAYYKVLWVASGVVNLPAELAPAVFDFAVHSGKDRAVKTLQGVVGAEVDGDLGPQTVGKITPLTNDAKKLRKLRNDYVIARGIFLMNDVQARPKDVAFVEGWFKRVVGQLDFAY